MKFETAMPLEASSEVLNRTAPLVELFSAIQGEGLNVGTRQLFIRFAFCDLRCHFCDSAHTWKSPETCQVERSPGERNFEIHPNPVNASTLLEWVERLDRPGVHDSISLTGGEPLLQAAFLAEFLPLLRQHTSLPIYLESGGHQPERLSRVLPYLDSVGMDFKLPSVSGETCWDAHAAFLRHCFSAGVEVFVKIILSAQTDPAELLQAAELIAAVNPQVPVFLQPVTALREAEQAAMATESSKTPLVFPPTPDQVLTWQTLMKQSLKSVRVIPQTHKMLGQR